MRVKVIENLRKTGIPFISDVPWGTHIAAFYETKKDYFDIMVPYFAAGLENNEYCMWIVSDPVKPMEAVKALKGAVPELDTYWTQIEILSDAEWYRQYGSFQGKQVLKNWVSRCNFAESNGYEGMRVCGGSSWLTKRYWKDFMDYERDVEEAFESFNIIAICPYQLSQCELYQILDVVSHHQFAFVKSEHDWKYARNIAKFERINAMTRIAAGIVHEVRNPLSVARATLQLLQTKDDLKSYRKFFSSIIDELDRANGIITEYLSLATTKQREVKEYNLNDIVSDLLPLLRAEAIPNRHDIVFHPSTISDIYVDSSDIRQVILNLVRNGLEAMPEPGVVEISTYMQKGYVVMEVKDSGRGIPQEIIQKLGTPFLTTKENGTGLGLYIVFKILDNYHAHTKVTSSPAGTVFRVYFPSSASANAQ
ncbi:MAG: hypothetical protein GX063_08660 [Firmicutes bacterium]|nr:hypothetical protein [Bacillota bacterium]